jgi:hypothetical protein
MSLTPFVSFSPNMSFLPTQSSLFTISSSHRISFRGSTGKIAINKIELNDRRKILATTVHQTQAWFPVLHQSSFLLYSTKSQAASSSYSLRAGLSCFVDQASRKQPASLAASAAALIISRPWPLPRSDGSIYKSGRASELCRR